MLKLSAMFFDPLGLISPVTLQSKLIFKSLCINKIEWDNVIPKDLLNKWTKFVNELSNTTLHIDRYMGVEENTNDQILEIHGFADASSQAFAVYLRVVTQGNTTVKFWCAKSKVASMKQLTIPGLELLSCELLTKLIKSVNLAIEKEMIVNRIICWADSKIAYYWITQVNKDWKLWVENRVNKIRNIVPGTENPADISTRELKSSLIVNSTLWWHGSQFFLLTEENWPSNTPVILDKEIIELKQNQNTITVLTSTTESVIPEIGKVIDIKSYSSLQKLLRITAYVMKFVDEEYIKTKRILRITAFVMKFVDEEYIKTKRVFR